MAAGPDDASRSHLPRRSAPLTSLLFLLALATLIAHVATAIQVLLGNRSIRALRDLPPLAGPLPRVSIIIPARNEERNLEEALRSILALDYDNLEIDVVDDRSTDRTGEILDRMATADPRLRIVHVRELPPGWLGKNHALWLGAEKATGEFLLFTDADVVMAPSILRRAVGALVADRLDHLTAAPERAVRIVHRRLLALLHPVHQALESQGPREPQPRGDRRLQPRPRRGLPRGRRASGDRHAAGRRPQARQAAQEERFPSGIRLRAGDAAGGVVRLRPGADPGANEERLLRRGLPGLGGGRLDGDAAHHPGLALPGAPPHHGSDALAQPGLRAGAPHPLLDQRPAGRRAPLVRPRLPPRHPALPLHPLARHAADPVAGRYRLAGDALFPGRIKGHLYVLWVLAPLPTLA
ncbi:MAG: hypothetical protein DMF53_28775 [Acidobacteria bacterium]|nr:MAG: hypothetical protein DMF53_28775 [Acidobacteriota bacterium]